MFFFSLILLWSNLSYISVIPVLAKLVLDLFSRYCSNFIKFSCGISSISNLCWSSKEIIILSLLNFVSREHPKRKRKKQNRVAAIQGSPELRNVPQWEKVRYISLIFNYDSLRIKFFSNRLCIKAIFLKCSVEKQWWYIFLFIADKVTRQCHFKHSMEWRACRGTLAIDN